MGFYDCACGVTGVSLKGAGAAAVLLQLFDGVYRPIALALKGNYNRLGTIDYVYGTHEGSNAHRVSAYFASKLKSGEFVIDERTWDQNRRPVTDIDSLLWGFERNTNDNPKTALLNGEPVVVELVCLTVWNAIVGATVPTDAHLATLFDGVPVAEEIYAGPKAEMNEDWRQLAVVSAFLAQCGIAWQPTEAGGQDFAEEMWAQLTAARQTFHDCPPVLAGLDAYAGEVDDLLHDS